MSDTLKKIADNLGVSTINGSYLSGIADYYGVDLATSTDLMRDILTEVGGNPATSTDYLQDIVLELGGTVTINDNWMEAWEAITASPPSAPVNTVAPVISGTNFYVGDVLTTTDGTWTGSPTFTYQWYNENDSENIVGATSSTYTLGSVLAGIDISCKVTGTNAAGSDTGVSNVIGTIPLFAPTNIDPPVIDALTTWLVGMNIYFYYNYWAGNPVPTLTYQWQRDGVNISGETNTTYLLDYADEGYLVGVKCTATNSEGTDFVLSNTVLIEA
jgi:hypothetical protein